MVLKHYLLIFLVSSSNSVHAYCKCFDG